MALNLGVQYPGRITAGDANYTYGSAKNETSPGAGDGTPYELARANDIFGFQQALLRSAGIVPSGSAETQLDSEYFQAVVELAAGRAHYYDDSGAANALVADLRANQQAPASYFDGMRVNVVPVANNTGATTINVGGLGIRTISISGLALVANDIVAGDEITLVFNSGLNQFRLVSGLGMSHIESHDNGSVVSPIQTIYRNSVSPANNDWLGATYFQGNDSNGNRTLFASIKTRALDVTDAAESALMMFSVVQSGVYVDAGYFGDGLVVGTPSGGAPGYGKINALDYLVDGVSIVTGTVVSGYTAGGVFNIENDIGGESNRLEVTPAFVVSTWESVGATGSGADNIWAAMDSIPTTAKFLIYRIELFVFGSTNNDYYDGFCYHRKEGSLTGAGGGNQVAGAAGNNRSGSSETFGGGMTTAIVPLSSSQQFEFNYQLTGTAASANIYLTVVGWIE